jgi:hypothetical protein
VGWRLARHILGMPSRAEYLRRFARANLMDGPVTTRLLVWREAPAAARAAELLRHPGPLVLLGDKVRRAFRAPALLRPAGRLAAGDLVGYVQGAVALAAEVLEDRGDLGPAGQQVVRLRVRLGVTEHLCPTDFFETEAPADQLTCWPRCARPRRRC